MSAPRAQLHLGARVMCLKQHCAASLALLCPQTSHLGKGLLPSSFLRFPRCLFQSSPSRKRESGGRGKWSQMPLTTTLNPTVLHFHRPSQL